MVLSVIIVNYKVPHYLQLCLQSVLRATASIETELIVVDNASGDESLGMLHDNFPQVRVIANAENVGFSKANNQGVAAASGKYICILNPDTVLPEDCFKTLLAFAERQKKMGAVGIRLIDGTGNFLPESKRNLTTPRVSFKKLLGMSRSYYATHLKEDEIGEVEILVGAFMFIKRSVYVKLGGFDEDYFMYGEDIDLSYRLLKKGYRNHYFGKLTALHFKGESTVKDKLYIERFYRAMRIFSKKHFYKNVWVDQIFGVLLRVVKSLKPSVKQPQDSKHDFDKLFWVGDKQHIPVALKTEIFQVSIEALKREALFHKTKNRFIFDLESCTVKAVLETLEVLKNSQNTFRIRPSNCNFSCGSDSAHQRGAVENWS